MTNQIIRINLSAERLSDEDDDLDPNDFESSLPIQHTRIDFEDENLGIYVGVWDTTDMVEKSGAYPCDEWMWILEGEVGIRNTNSQQVEKIKSGEAFVLAKGYDCQWIQKGYLKKIFVIVEGNATSGNNIQTEKSNHLVSGIIRPQSPTKTNRFSSFFTEKNPISSEPKCRQFLFEGVQSKKRKQDDYICYENDDCTFICGTFESEPFLSKLKSLPFNQFVYVNKGSLSIIDGANNEHQFRAGDAFCIPKNTICYWQVNEEISLYYVDFH